MEAGDKFIGSFELALPYNKDFPAGATEGSEVALVAKDVAFSFFLPEFGICGRGNFTVFAMVHMPETAVKKDDIFCRSQIPNISMQILNDIALRNQGWYDLKNYEESRMK